MIKTENFEKILVKSPGELREWLSKNHQQQQSVWLVTYKKHVTDNYVSISEVLDELLCFGWIDGIRRKLHEDTTMQLISPRKTNHWTKTYKDRFLRLEKEGRMTDAGRQLSANSKEQGLWNYMDDVDALEILPDFMEQLKKYDSALENFRSFGHSSQRFTLRWIKLAKTALTKTKRMEQAALLAADNKKIPGL
jgi:uncharacterized protein YdeI (YjbR/CyaY-like superfamily)